MILVLHLSTQSALACSLILDIHFVIDRGCSNHEAFYRGVYFNNAVIDPGWKAAKLPFSHYEPLAVYLYEDAAFEHDEYLIALRMIMRGGVGPRAFSVVVPDLKLLGFEGDVVGRRVAGQEGGEPGEMTEMVFGHACCVLTRVGDTARL
jgi:hypothetical protein